MLTVLEAINLSTEYLNKRGIESSKLNAEMLLAHILNCKRIDLYLSFDRPLSEEEKKSYRDLLKRRGNFEPLQYILGKVEFYGLPFKVNPSVLIPRQETEILIEAVLNKVSKENHVTLLDIGTGSGNIAVSISKHLVNAKITAVDLSESALSLAIENSLLNNTNGQIEFVHADVTKTSFTVNMFDVVVSNPPYISVKDYAGLSPELRIYEPKSALTDDEDGLKFYRIIASTSTQYLKRGGWIFFELGEGQHDVVKNILIQNGFINIEIKKDYLGIERVICGELS